MYTTGGLGMCDTAASANNSMYCEFERFFEDDVSRALEISSYRVNILFVKRAAFDSVLVHFRINPPVRTSNEPNVTVALANLHLQVHDINSELYKGNVTIRVDSLWVWHIKLLCTYLFIYSVLESAYDVRVYRKFTLPPALKQRYSRPNGTSTIRVVSLILSGVKELPATIDAKLTDDATGECKVSLLPRQRKYVVVQFY